MKVLVSTQAPSLSPLLRPQKPCLHTCSLTKRSGDTNFYPEKFASISRHTNIIFLRSSSRNPQESTFFDENGALEDMDGYLNYLSLEYDSVWDTKPSWCQPWTITLTGVVIVSLSWLILHSVPISTIAAALICTWWYVFLYAYPKQYADMIAERRKKVTDGLEDTYGSKK